MIVYFGLDFIIRYDENEHWDLLRLQLAYQQIEEGLAPVLRVIFVYMCEYLYTPGTALQFVKHCV